MHFYSLLQVAQRRQNLLVFLQELQILFGGFEILEIYTQLNSNDYSLEVEAVSRVEILIKKLYLLVADIEGRRCLPLLAEVSDPGLIVLEKAWDVILQHQY